VSGSPVERCGLSPPEKPPAQRLHRGQVLPVELDMHFSLSKDLTFLRTFLATLRTDGPQRITTLLEREEY